MEEVPYPETSVDLYRTTPRCIPEDSMLHLSSRVSFGGGFNWNATDPQANVRAWVFEQITSNDAIPK
jgi:hypothetical protein